MTATEQASVVEQSLARVGAIELDVERLDLSIESDLALQDQVRLEGAAGEGAPTLRQQGNVLVVHQRGSHRLADGTPVVLRVPAERCPPIRGELQHGRLSVKNVFVGVDVKSGTGVLRVEGGTGPATLTSGSGRVSTHDREGAITLISGTGGVEASRINGRLNLNNGTGPTQISHCIGPIHANQGVGDFLLTDWMGEIRLNIGTGAATFKRCDVVRASLNSGSGAVRFEKGVLGGLNLVAGSGAVISTALLAQVPNGASPKDEQTYQVEAGSGNVSFALPKDIPARVEVVVKEGEVESEVPLVNVGRPGPRSAARRYVGVSNTAIGRGEAPKVNLRIRSEKGDVELRLDGKVRTRSGRGSGAAEEQRAIDRDDEIRAILDALERKEISVDDAEALLDAIT